jgi:hypothetical protein
LALIRENAALLFGDILDSLAVWLSGAVLQREMTANSGRWEAKVGFDQTELLIMEKNTCFWGLFFRGDGEEV